MLDKEEMMRHTAQTFLEMGRIEEAEAQYDEAIRNYREALSYYQQLNCVNGIGKTNCAIAEVHLLRTEYDEAQALLDQILVLFKEDTEDDETLTIKADVLYVLSRIAREKFNQKQALAYLKQVWSIYQKQNNRQKEARVLGGMALTYQAIGERQTAREYFLKAIDVSKELEDKRAEGIYLGNLASLYSEMGALTNTDLQSEILWSEARGARHTLLSLYLWRPP